MSWFETKAEKANRLQLEREQFTKELLEQVKISFIDPIQQKLKFEVNRFGDIWDDLGTRIFKLEEANRDFQKQILELQEAKTTLTKQNEELVEQLDKASERDRVKDSDEPYAEVVSWSVDSSGNIETRIDWNPAFIQHLIKHGYRGGTDAEIIEKWLRGVYSQFAGVEG